MYFTVRAGRLMGKVTAARWMVDHFHNGDKSRAVWLDVDTALDLDELVRSTPVIP